MHGYENVIEIACIFSRNDWLYFCIIVLFVRLSPALTSAAWSAMSELEVALQLEPLLLELQLLVVMPQVTGHLISLIPCHFTCAFLETGPAWFTLKLNISVSIDMMMLWCFALDLRTFRTSCHLLVSLTKLVFCLYSQGGGEERGEEGRVRGVRWWHGLRSLWLNWCFCKNTIKEQKQSILLFSIVCVCVCLGIEKQLDVRCMKFNVKCLD